MKKYTISFNLAFVILVAGLVWFFPRQQEQVDPINYELFEYRFKQNQRSIDSLWIQIEKTKMESDSIKLQIIKDEKRINNFGKRDLDSAFRTLF